MPQSLLKWQPHAATSAADADSDDEEKGSWIQVPSRELSLSAAKAKLVAQMAVEKSCTNLEALWRKAGILRSDNFSLPDWRALRVKFVVVLTGPEASKYWMSRTSALYLCSCTYFAVAGRCEHEQCVHHILGAGNIDLTVVGSKGGRPPKPGPSKRGWSSVQLHHEHARADAQDQEHREKRRRAVGYFAIATSKPPAWPTKGVRDGCCHASGLPLVRSRSCRRACLYSSRSVCRQRTW